MPHRISEGLLCQFSELVAGRLGLHFSSERWWEVERAIRSAARDFDFEDAESFVQWLTSSPLTRAQLGTLATHLTVGETYFFRERTTFEMLEREILPQLIQSRRDAGHRLRIWSAGCATGEEPSSLAILLSGLLPDMDGWQVTLLGTDINPHFLSKAREGVYGEWSFRETPEWVRKRYFVNRGPGRFEIQPHLKRLLTFSCLNLAEDGYPSLLDGTVGMDVILCRNVLMYFSAAHARAVIRKLQDCLAEGGWLIVSPAETSHVNHPSLRAVNFQGATFYRKGGNAAERAAPPGRMPEDEPAIPPQAPPPPDAWEAAAYAVAGFSEAVPADSGEEKGPESRPADHAEAVALYERGCYEAAGSILVSLSESSNDAKVMALLARVYANLGRRAESLEWCEKAIAADKLNASLHYLHATILQEQGSTEAAIAALKRALYLDPEFVLAHFSLGSLALRQGRVAESAKHFGNALALLELPRGEEILPESEGVTANRLREIIRSTAQGEKPA